MALTIGPQSITRLLPEASGSARSRGYPAAKSRSSACARSAANSTAIAANFGDGNFWGSVSLSGAFVVAFGAAFVGSLFSSDAWNNVTFAAAEVKDPQRNLPLALLLGTGMVSLLYVLANVGYLNALPMVGDPTGATALERGITGATQDRVATAAMVSRG